MKIKFDKWKIMKLFGIQRQNFILYYQLRDEKDGLQTKI